MEEIVLTAAAVYSAQPVACRALFVRRFGFDPAFGARPLDEPIAFRLPQADAPRHGRPVRHDRSRTCFWRRFRIPFVAPGRNPGFVAESGEVRALFDDETSRAVGPGAPVTQDLEFGRDHRRLFLLRPAR